MDPGEHWRGHGIERGRRHSRTAGEQEQRIRLLTAADGRDPGEGQANLPAAGPARILRDE